jgi:hypothetical protein
MRSPSETFRHQKGQYNPRALTNLIPHPGLAQLKLFVDKYGKMSSAGQFAAPERGYRLKQAAEKRRTASEDRTLSG